MVQIPSTGQLRVLTFRTANYFLDFAVFAVAFTMGFATWWYIKVGSANLAELKQIDWVSFAVLFCIFYGANFFYLAYYQAYHSPRQRLFSTSIVIYLKSVLAALLLAVLVAFFFPFLVPSRIQFFSGTAYAFVLLVLKERLVRFALCFLWEREYSLRRTVIVGKSKELIQTIKEESERDHILGIKLIGLVKCPNGGFEAKELEDLGIPLLGELDELTNILEENYADTVVFFEHDLTNEQLKDAIWKCEERGLEVWVKLDLLDRIIYNATIGVLNEIPFINFHGARHNSAELFVKYCFDRIASLILLICFSPVLLIVALGVKLTSPGRIFFKQYRAGLNGRRFLCYKFRSMVEDAERLKEKLKERNEISGPAFKISDDPRITHFGHFIRRSSLDELPQLWNVLRGDMSLVGPRPLPVEEVKMFEGWHRRRLTMKPGITGMWQVNGRSNIENFDNWAKMDLAYIDRWNLWVDIAILLKTIPVVLFSKGAK